MKKLALCVIVLLSTCFAPTYAQSVTFAEHIAPIIFNNCTSCHRQGEIAPMPFTNYSEVAAYAGMIDYVTQIKYMPPWKPDPAYRTLLDERRLSATEIQLIKDWVTQGAPEGNPALTPAPPVFPAGSQLGTPDAVITMTQKFAHAGNNTDNYRIFVLPTSFATAKNISAIEFRPQNTKIAHHAIFALDTTGQARLMDAQTPQYGYDGFGGFGFNNVQSVNWNAWVPGNTPRYTPTGIGRRLPKNADILVQMHYGPTPIAQTDSSVVNLFFSNAPVTRYVQTTPILSPLTLQNGPFRIQPNTIKAFKAQYTVPSDISLLSLAPHCHLLGKSWKVYAIKPQGDTIPLVKIDDWDFQWQGNYVFPTMLKIPAGSKIIAEGTYDNTTNNPLNPNNPPQLVQWGESTTDEMFLVYFSYVPYQLGDENIALTNENENNITQLKNITYPVYPNPTNGRVTFGYSLARTEKINVALYDMQGKKIQDILQNKIAPAGKNSLQINTNNLPKGTYFVQINTQQGYQASEKIIVQ
jgi:hypothetical protein